MTLRRTLLSLLLLVVLAAPAAAQVTATSTVEAGTGPWAEYWCYTIDFSWSAPKSLSHLTTFVGLDGLECACDPGLFGFPTPAGTTTGVEDGVVCTLEYYGEYICTGDPSLPGSISSLAAVKFDPIAEPCDAGKTGSGSVTFYSLIAPGPDTVHTGVIVVKEGQDVVTGDITGVLPAQDCSLTTESSAWGGVKSRYED